MMKYLQPEYVIPTIIASVLTLGGNGIKWALELRDSYVINKRIEAQQAETLKRLDETDRKLSETDRKVERILGWVDAQREEPQIFSRGRIRK
jgi:hypothetical protein